MAPNWIRTENVSQNSLRAGSLPRNWFTSKRWPVDDTGRNSVSPSTMPSTMALKKSNDIRRLRADREGHGAWTGQPQVGDVRLFDLKFLTEFAAGGVGTSNRRHQSPRDRLDSVIPRHVDPVPSSVLPTF